MFCMHLTVSEASCAGRWIEDRMWASKACGTRGRGNEGVEEKVLRAIKSLGYLRLPKGDLSHGEAGLT